MIAVVQPVPPPTVDAIIAWFRALDGTDLSNALLGVVTLAVVGLGALGLLALARWAR